MVDISFRNWLKHLVPVIFTFHTKSLISPPSVSNVHMYSRPEKNSVVIIQQGKSEGFDSRDRPSNLTEIGFKLSIFQPVWPTRKRLSWVVTSVTLTFDLWPWPFAWTSLLSLVITPENFIMIRWWEHGEKGVTDGQTDGQTDRRTDRQTDRQTDGLNHS